MYLTVPRGTVLRILVGQREVHDLVTLLFGAALGHQRWVRHPSIQNPWGFRLQSISVIQNSDGAVREGGGGLFDLYWVVKCVLPLVALSHVSSRRRHEHVTSSKITKLLYSR